MKLRYLYLAIGILYSASMISCGDSYKEKTEVVPCAASKDALTFEVSPTEVQTVDITSEANWKVAVDQGGGSWLTVSPLEGTGNSTLNISATKNSGPKRSATLTIAAKGAELRTITVIQDGYKGTMYDFSDLTGWEKTGLQAGVEPITIVDCPDCENGKALKIFTRAGEEYAWPNADRFKVQTTTQFGSGRYEWRVYVPEMGMNDQASIGAFVYFDDGHELDFEICSGTAADRSTYNVKSDEVLCLVSSQANPFFTDKFPIKCNAWHTLVLDLKLENDKYLGEWLVDGKSMKKQLLNFGEKDAYFRALCSVENLVGMGDHPATRENYALFDYLEYAPYDYSMKPIIEGQLPPEPEGTTTRWDFDEDGVIPAGWTNAGGTIADGILNLPNSTNLTYTEAVGAGKYTWVIDVPSVGVGEKWLAGGNIAATNAEERSFSMFVFPGTENDRAACQIPPVPGQMLVRCYTESLGVYGVPIDPGKHTLTIDLRLKDGMYSAAWIIDGDIVKIYDTWYTPEAFQFGFSFITFANGGGWQGDKETQGTYTAKYDSFEYKNYIYE